LPAAGGKSGRKKKKPRPKEWSGRGFLQEKAYHKIKVCQVESCILINIFKSFGFNPLEDAEEAQGLAPGNARNLKSVDHPIAP
jgi:hypothetical protein